MQIILNPDLEKYTPSEQRLAWIAEQKKLAVANLSNKLMWKLKESNKDKAFAFIGSNINMDEVENLQLGYLGMLSQSYSNHEKIEIAPHDIWYLILSEIAIIIKANTEACRPLFTSSQEKIDISVPVDDVTKIDLALVVTELRKLIPVDVDIFVPKLSTSTPDAQIAMYAALCDGVSAYYSYSTFMCGIPEIRLTGTRQDWLSLLQRAGIIAAMFGTVGLFPAVEYMIRVGDILDKIQCSFDIVDAEFWKDIFRSKNVGSGGELTINGWITDLYYEKRDMKKLENFMTAVTIVPYKNLGTGREFKGIYGAFECVRTDDDFLRAGYSNLIFEMEDKKLIHVPEKSKIILAR